MTTYQDPPLHSRRAARQGERAEAENAAADTSAERAIAAGSAEPLNYATTQRPPLPQYDGQDLRPRRTVESTDHGDLPPTEALPRQDAPSGYRSRDYSPEGRRAAPSWAPQYGGVGDDGTVEFHTQGRENVPVPSVGEPVAEQTLPPIAPAPASADAEAAAAEPAAVPVEHPEHTMTRRELRALREAGLITDVTDLSQPIHLPIPVPDATAHAAIDIPVHEMPQGEAAEAVVDEAPPAEAPAEIPAAVAPIAEPIPLVAPAPQPSSRLDSALAEFDALAAGREPLVPDADAPVPLSGRRSAAPVFAEPVVEPEAASPAFVEPLVEPVAETAIPAAETVPEPDVPPIAEVPVAEVPVAADAVADPFPQPEPLPPSTDSLSAFDALFQPPSAAIPVVVALPVDADVEHHDVVEAQLEPEAPVTIDQLLAAPAPQGSPAQVPPPVYPTPVDLPAPPAGDAPPAPAPSAFPSMPPETAAPAFISPPPAVPPTASPAVDASVTQPSAEPTVGHWSTQADIDDAEQINDSTISRSVGAGNGAITTSALVLPSVPDITIGGPLGDGGQILLTGSISLPDSLASTGAHPSQLDESDLDHLLDPGDHQVANTDSTPVRAIRAVSTHTASGGIISPSKPKGTRGFTILIIAASAMAVVVVGLLVAGLVSGTL